MKIKKILIYLIFAFVMVLPFNVKAETVEYDFNFHPSKIQMFDSNYLEKMKLAGYNAIINDSFYKEKHPKIESYNEFYLNHAYFVAYDADGIPYIYYTFDTDYIELFSFTDGTNYFIGSDYSRKCRINNEGNAGTCHTGNFYGWIDKNINNSDFVYEYGLDDLKTTNSKLPDFYYPILATNRSFKYRSIETYLYTSSITSFLKEYFPSFFYTNPSAWKDVTIKTLNSVPGNVFRHPYNSEETDKITINKTTRIFSINSSNYSSFKINYNINQDIKGKWYDILFTDYLEKKNLDWLKIEINSTNSISYPRRYTNYKQGNNLELVKEPCDFGNNILNTKFTSYISNLGGYNGAVNGYFNFDLRDLPENTIITIYLEYDPNYIEFEAIELPETNFIEYDLSGKYAVGLVPKFVQSNNKFSLLYQGDFTTYYAFNSNNYNVYDSELLNSLDIYSKKILNFSRFSNTELYEKPIFYLINNYYSDSSKISKIKYNPDYFELLIYNSIEDVVISTYNGHSYFSPSLDYSSNNSGFNNTNNSSINSSEMDFSLTNLFNNLPDLISGLGNAFSAIGQCITIAFNSLPELVQVVLYLSLAITVILVAIKLIK